MTPSAQELETLRQAAQLAISKGIALKLPPAWALALLDSHAIVEQACEDLGCGEDELAQSAAAVHERAEAAEELVEELRRKLAKVEAAIR